MLNEPETSLHPELLPALARLMQRAARDTQVVVVTHSDVLASALVDGPDAVPDSRQVRLQLEHGETVVDGREGVLDQPAWHWPSR